MGRSPNFTESDIPKPTPLTSSDVLDLISKLNVGDEIQFKLKEITDIPEISNTMLRQPSCYGYDPMVICEGPTFVVSNVNADKTVELCGLRAIACDIKEQKNAVDYFSVSYLTTDGFIREIEACGILFYVVGIVIVNK